MRKPWAGAGCKSPQDRPCTPGNPEAGAFDTTWLPLFYGQLLTQEKLEQQTIYNILENEYEIPITKGTYRFSAESADRSEERRVGKECRSGWRSEEDEGKKRAWAMG